MKKFLKWLGFVAAALAGVALRGEGIPLEQFTRLMQQCVGLGDRELRLMTPTARERFTQASTDEIAAMHGYLQSLGEG